MIKLAKTDVTCRFTNLSKKGKFLFVTIQTLRQNLELYLSPKNKNKSIYD